MCVCVFFVSFRVIQRSK